jgi:hypothetical protein
VLLRDGVVGDAPGIRQSQQHKASRSNPNDQSVLSFVPPPPRRYAMALDAVLIDRSDVWSCRRLNIRRYAPGRTVRVPAGSQTWIARAPSQQYRTRSMSV